MQVQTIEGTTMGDAQLADIGAGPHCVRFKTVTDRHGKRVKRCARFSGGLAGRDDDDMMGLDDLDDLSQQDFGPDFFGLGQFFDPEMLQMKLVACLAGAGGLLATTNVLENIDQLAGKTKTKAGIAIGVGIVGAMGLWRVSQAAALGFAGAVAGTGIANLVGSVAGIPSQLSAVEVTNVPAYRFFSPNRGPLPQLGQPIVTEDDPIALAEGFDAVEVTEESLGTWLR